LTFDDGPHPDITPAVLDRLERHGARAVFFVVGRHVQTAPWILQEIKERGHVVGNHSFAHPNDRQFGLAEYRRDLMRCQEIVTTNTGSAPRLFRPPSGRLSLASMIASKRLGLTTVTWSLDPVDWRCRTSEDAARAAAHVVNDVKPRDIVLLHDNNPAILNILDIVLPTLTEREMDLWQGLAHIEAAVDRTDSDVKECVPAARLQ
jgi:peptidoglycan/xylan/chitin deacetylase (PgdA/CDA1 family)